MMDDGIAIVVLEVLKNKLEPMGIEVIIAETDFQFCYHQINDDDFVIIVDAAYLGIAAGSVRFCKLQEILDSYGETNFQHDINIFDLIRLYTKQLKGYFIGIEIAEAGFGCELSQAIKVKMDAICLEVEKIIYHIVS